MQIAPLFYDAPREESCNKPHHPGAMPLPVSSLDILCCQTRTRRNWLPEPLAHETIHERFKCGPTSGNTCPVQVLLYQDGTGERAVACRLLRRATGAKTRSAPVTAIVAY